MEVNNISRMIIAPCSSVHDMVDQVSCSTFCDVDRTKPALPRTFREFSLPSNMSFGPFNPLARDQPQLLLKTPEATARMAAVVVAAAAAAVMLI